jgi:hypothetical protein
MPAPKTYRAYVRIRRAVNVASCGLLALVGCGGDRSPARPDGASSLTTAAVPSVSSNRARALGLTQKVPAAYQRVCAEQSAYAPVGARLCPPLIPAGRLKVSYAAPFSTQNAYRGGYLADVSSRTLSELEGEHIETNGGHWHYDVSWTPAVRDLIVHRGIERPANASKASQCRHVRLGSERVEACRVVPYEQGGGLNGGHIAYVWSHGRVTFVISLHGYANEPRVRAMTLALIEQVLREHA